MAWGASADEWLHFDLILGLAEHLLPVVSNPHAVVSERSTLKALGKVPSLYDSAGKVVGIGDWTNKRSTPRQVEAWQAQPDYGICLQTRAVRAIDIDIDDQVIADEVAQIVRRHIDGAATRHRSDSGKKLLAFHVEGPLSKRIIRTATGLIEFLADGQQCIVAGTHPKGARYVWQNGLPLEFVHVSKAVLDALWAELAERYAIAPTTEGGGPRKRGERLDIADDVVDFLADGPGHYGLAKDGAVIIDCPFAEGHSSGELGDTSTVYFPAGSNGYEKGHFVCLHASCAHRNDGDFLNALGYGLDAFEVVEDVVDVESLPAGAERAAARRELLPAFKRNIMGEIEPTLNNVLAGVPSREMSGVTVHADEFLGLVILDDGVKARPVEDVDYTELRSRLESRGFKPISGQMMRDAVHLTARRNRFDSAQNWLGAIEWDGVPRVEQFLTTYASVEDSDYARAVSRYLWTALAGRVLRPGSKADMAPVLIGAQGSRKSSLVAAIAPLTRTFMEVSLDDKDDNLSRRIKGKLVGELSELRGLHTKDLESIKAFMSTTHDEWVPKYMEQPIEYARRIVLIGTSNKDELFADETGERRWLPVRSGPCDPEGVARDRDQLWAEGAVLYGVLGGIDWSAEQLAAETGVHAQHRMSDGWDDVVHAWLNEPEAGMGHPPRTRDWLRASDVLVGALGFEPKNIKQLDLNRIGKILSVEGYVRKDTTINGKSAKVWKPKTAP